MIWLIHLFPRDIQQVSTTHLIFQLSFFSITISMKDAVLLYDTLYSSYRNTQPSVIVLILFSSACLTQIKWAKLHVLHTCQQEVSHKHKTTQVLFLKSLHKTWITFLCCPKIIPTSSLPAIQSIWHLRTIWARYWHQTISLRWIDYNTLLTWSISID